MFHVSLMVSTKQKPIQQITQKIKESKDTTTSENHQIMKEESKKQGKEQRNYKTARKHQNISKSIPTDKWTKFYDQKTVSEWIKKQYPTMLPIR